MTTTTIEWTQETWNPTVGCSKISEGCRNCYAIQQAHRNAAMGDALVAKGKNAGRLAYYEGLTERKGDTRTEWTGNVNFVQEALDIPIKRLKPTTYFVNSMSDLFHESVTDEQLDQIFAVMALTPQHAYQVLTKRPQRMLEYCSDPATKQRIFEATNEIDPMGRHQVVRCPGGWPLPNVWLGVTCENQPTADKRIVQLLQTPAAVRFLSCEPLLEEIQFPYSMQWHKCPACGTVQGDDGFNTMDCDSCGWRDYGDGEILSPDWVIVGGESGNNARPCDWAWIRSIVQQCKAAQVPCFVKQAGSNPWLDSISYTEADAGARLRLTGKGSNPDEWPQLMPREFPVDGGVA